MKTVVFQFAFVVILDLIQARPFDGEYFALEVQIDEDVFSNSDILSDAQDVLTTFLSYLQKLETIQNSEKQYKDQEFFHHLKSRANEIANEIEFMAVELLKHVIRNPQIPPIGVDMNEGNYDVNTNEVLDVKNISQAADIPEVLIMDIHEDIATSTEQIPPVDSTTLEVSTQPIRRKREDVPPEQETEQSVLKQEPINWNQCLTKADLDNQKRIEDQHIQDLKVEFDKLQELVKILREQQEVLNSLNEIDQKYCSDAKDRDSCKNSAKEEKLIKLLEALNENIPSIEEFKSKTLNNKGLETNQGDREITELKNEVEQLKSLVTKALSMQQSPNMGEDLGDELKRQNQEIARIKKQLRTLISLRRSTNQNVTDYLPSARNSEQSDLLNVRLIRGQIDDIQNQIRALLAKEGQEETVLMEQNPKADHLDVGELEKLNEDVEELKTLVGEAFAEESAEDLDGSILRTSMQRIERPMVHKNIPTKTLPIIHKNKDEAPSSRKSNTQETRSSDAEDIRKLLKTFDIDASNEEEEKTVREIIEEIQRELDLTNKKQKRKKNNNKKKNLAVQLLKVEKQLKENRKIDDDEDFDEDGDNMKGTLKKLDKVLKNLDKQGKGFEESSVEAELQSLQAAIDRLRPKDPKQDSNADFQIMLNKLVAQQTTSAPRPSQQFQINPQTLEFFQKQFALMQQNQLGPPPPSPFYNKRPFIPDTAQNIPPFFTNPNPSSYLPKLQPDASYQTDSLYQGLNNKQQFFPSFDKNVLPNFGPGTSGDSFNSQQSYGASQSGDPYATQQIEDLKNQIYGLQNAVSSLNRPEYIKKPEDQATIYKLDQEISDLKNIISNLNSNSNSGSNSGYSSADGFGQPDGNQDGSKGYSSGKDVVVVGKSRYARSLDSKNEDMSKAFESVANFLKDAFEEEEQASTATPPKKLERTAFPTHENLQQKLEDLRKQLEMTFQKSHTETSPVERTHHPAQPYGYTPSYETSYYDEQNKIKPIENKIKEKKLDIFEKVITKIIDIVVDKIAIAIPILIKKILGLNDESLKEYSTGDGYNYGGIQNLANLGIFGYIPLLILKLVNGLSSFISILKKNKFLKNILVPILVLVGVSAFVLFLIWWLQPDEDYQQKYEIGYGNDNYANYDYGSNNYRKNYKDNQNTDIIYNKRTGF